MKLFRIENTITRHVFGFFAAENTEDAIKAMMDKVGVAHEDDIEDDINGLDVRIVDKVVGREAIEVARDLDLRLHKYADPVEDERDDLTVDEAEEVGRSDLALIYIPAEMVLARLAVSGGPKVC